MVTSKKKVFISEFKILHCKLWILLIFYVLFINVIQATQY